MVAYPLSWPEGWPRTSEHRRERARFHKKGSRNWADALTITDGVSRVLTELERMGIDRQDAIVSTNVRTRLDGLPRSGEREPTDPGAAVYWQERGGARRVLAIDQYNRVADNLAAIAATLDALRAVERHGGARILERAFTGFTALAAPGARDWRTVMGFDSGPVSHEQLRARYRQLAQTLHPDKGGTNDAFAELNTAYEQAKASHGT